MKQAIQVGEQAIRDAATSQGPNSVAAKSLREAERRQAAGERVVFSMLGSKIGVSSRL